MNERKLVRQGNIAVNENTAGEKTGGEKLYFFL